VLPGTNAPEDAIIFRLDCLDDLMGHPNQVNFFWGRVDGSESIPIVIGALDEMFENSGAIGQSRRRPTSLAAWSSIRASRFRNCSASPRKPSKGSGELLREPDALGSSRNHLDTEEGI